MFRVVEDPDVWVSVNKRGWAQQQYEKQSPPPKEDQNEIVEVFTTQVAELRKGINALRQQQRGGAAGAGAQNKRKRQCDQSGSEKRTIAKCPHVCCKKCGQAGHIAPHCTEGRQDFG